MVSFKRFFTSLPHRLCRGESSSQRQQQATVSTDMATRQSQEPLRPNSRRANDREHFMSRHMRGPLALQFAIELSKASPEVEEEMRRIAASEGHLPENPSELRHALEMSLAEQRFAIELSKASPEVKEEMRRIATSEGHLPENPQELRQALEMSMPKSIKIEACIKAFDTITEGHNQFFRGENPSLKTVVEDLPSAEPIPAELISTLGDSLADTIYSTMSLGVRRFRAWAAENGLEIVPTSGFNNNCMLHALMKHASGDYSADFHDAAVALKAELVEKFPDEVASERTMLPAGEDYASFNHALQRINEMFNTSMEVCVVQAGRNGLPIMHEQPEGLPGKTPVVLFNSGAHFEAIVARR